MPVFPETDWFDGVPDWVCEILSPSNARLDRIVKTLLYAQLGVVNLWLIDSNLQTLEAFQLHDSRWLLIGYFANDQAVSIAPFAEHTFFLSDLWL
jgi:Uma2 family endonuclease